MAVGSGLAPLRAPGPARGPGRAGPGRPRCPWVPSPAELRQREKGQASGIRSFRGPAPAGRTPRLPASTPPPPSRVVPCPCLPTRPGLPRSSAPPLPRALARALRPADPSPTWDLTSFLPRLSPPLPSALSLALPSLKIASPPPPLAPLFPPLAPSGRAVPPETCPPLPAPGHPHPVPSFLLYSGGGVTTQPDLTPQTGGRGRGPPASRVCHIGPLECPYRL